jgi:hypothetical protein
MDVSDYTAVVRALILAAALLAPAAPPAAGQDAQAQAGDVTVGATFHYRGFSRGGRSYFLDQHLVVEVALSGEKGKRANVNAAQFSLQVNGGKRVLMPEPAGLVAYSMKWQWEDRGVRAQAGPVVIGGPGTEPRFPGDRPRVPLPRAPEPERPGAADPAEEETLGEMLAAGALPEGDVALPVSGYLYFRYEKKTKSLKKLQLLYQAPGGAVTLRLK